MLLYAYDGAKYIHFVYTSIVQYCKSIKKHIKILLCICEFVQNGQTFETKQKGKKNSKKSQNGGKSEFFML